MVKPGSTIRVAVSALALVSAFATSKADATTLITAAWRSPISSATEDNGPDHIARDHSGFIYIAYQKPNLVKLKKVSPAEDTMFDVFLDTFVNQPDSVAVHVHTTPTGIGEFEDVVVSYLSGSGNEATALYRVDPSGNLTISAPPIITNI